MTPKALNCYLAQYGLSIITNGRVGPCCDFSDNYADFNSEISLADYLKSERALKLRQNLLNGSKDTGCQTCWSMEEAGLISKRVEFNELLKENSEEQKYFLDIQLSNLCNLKCRTCSVYNSSQWETEYLSLAADVFGRYPKNSAYFKNAKKKNFDLSFFKNNLEFLKQLKQINFFGGEPLMDQDHQELLDYLISTNLAPQISLAYGTNGLLLNEAHFKTWKNFKNVSLALSQDGIEKTFEYMRFPANWVKYLEKFKLVQAYQGDQQFNILVNVTYSILNLMSLPETLLWLAHEKMKIHLNPVFNPEYHTVTNLPLEQKKIVESFFGSFYFKYPEIKSDLQVVLDFMNSKQPNEVHFMNLIKATEHADQWRKQKLSVEMPETYKLLNHNERGLYA